MAGISFDIRGDNKDFLLKMEQTKQAVNSASKTIQNLGKNFNIDGAQNQIAALNTVIKSMEASISQTKDRLENMQAATISAMNAGDAKKVSDITAQMDKETQTLMSLTSELNEYRDALRTVESTSGMPASTQVGATETIRLFSNEDDYNKAEELRAKVAELQSQISQLDSTDASMPTLRQALLDSTQELDKMDNAAAKAASQLGAGLGSRAVEASERMYKLNQAVADQRASIATLSTSVRDAANNLARLKSSGADAAQIEQAQSQLDGLNNALRNATNELNNLEAEQVDATTQWGQMSGAISGIKMESYRTQMRALQQELVSVTIEYRNMSAAERESAQGRALAQKMQQLSEKAGTLKDVIADVQKQISNVSSDTRMFDSFTQGFQLIVSGAGAASGAMAMLGVSEEDLQATQTALQASLAASNFLTQAQTALQKESALMMGISQLQTAAAAKAINVKTAAEGKGVIATTAATVAQKIYNAVANANPYVLLATAILTVVGALYAFAKGSAEAKKKEEAAQKAAEEAAEAQREYTASIASAAAKPIAKIEELSRTWKSLSNDMQRNEFIKNNATEFNNLGFQVNNINDAETLLVKNTEAVKKACVEKAKAAASSALIIKKYEEILTNELSKQTKVKYKPVEEGKRTWVSWATMQDAGGKWAEEANAALAKGMSADQGVYRTTDAALAAAATRTAIADARKAAQEANAVYDKKNEAIQADIDKLVTEMNNSNDAAAKYLAGVKQATKTQPKATTTSGRTSNKAEDEAKKIEDARKKLAEALEKINAQNIADEIVLMHDGNEKVLAEIQNEYAQRQQEIIKQAEELAKTNKDAGIKADDIFAIGGMSYEGLTSEQVTALERSLELAQKAASKKTQEAYQEEAKTLREKLTDGLAVIEDFEKERTAIIARETKRREEIQKNAKLTDTEKQDLTKRSYYTQAQDLAAVSNKEFFASEDYSKIFSNLARLSTKTLSSIKARLQDVIKTSKELKPEELKAFQEQIDKITTEEESRNPIKSVVEGLKKLIAARKELGEAQVKYAEAQAQWTAQQPTLEAEAVQATNEKTAAEKEYNDLVASGSADVGKLAVAWQKMSIATNKAQKATEKLSKAHKQVEDATEGVSNASNDVTEAQDEWRTNMKKVAEACGAAADALQKVTDLLGIADDSTFGEIINGAVKGLQTMQSVLTVILTIAVAIESSMWWLLVIGAAVGILANIGSIFNASKIKKANEEIERQQDILDNLEYTYKRLQSAADELFGTDYITNYNQQLANLESQATAYRKQIAAEQSKGKSADEDKIKDYEESLRDVLDEISDMQKELASKFTGTDRSSAAEQFVESWLEAKATFASTKDAILSDYKDLIKNMIIQGAAAKIIDQILQPMWDNLNTMLAKNDIYGAVDYLVGAMDTFYTQADDGMNILWTALEARGYDMKSLISDADSELTGMSRTYGSASEEAIDALTAQTATENFYVSSIPTISENVAAIRSLLQGGNSVEITGISSADLLKMQTEYLSNLPAISANTAETAQQCANMVSECHSIVTQIKKVIKPKGSNPADRVYMAY